MLLQRNRHKKLELIWGARPIRTPHPYLGTKSRWIERSRMYEVVRFSEGTRAYGVFKSGVRIAEKHSLSGAKRAAERDAAASGAATIKQAARSGRTIRNVIA